MKNKFFKKIRNYFLLIIIYFLKFVFYFIPVKILSNLGELFGVLFSFFASKSKEIICKNLDIVYGKDKFSKKRKKMIL